MMDELPSTKSPDRPAADEHNKAAQCSVISVYRTKIADTIRNVTVVWCKSLINHSLSVTFDRQTGDAAPPFTCKVDLKPWPFWSKKGFKSLELDGGRRVDVFWDLRSAKFSGSGPEPASGYYVALVCNEEVVLLLGDCKKEAYKRTKSRPSLEDAALVSKRENVFGKKCFSTRARFQERKEHDIVVENSISGPKEPEMWISVDGIVLIHVSNLQWKFRGNETVLVERVPVQVFWDVHDWLFAEPGAGYALFIFKPGMPVPAGVAVEDRGKWSTSLSHYDSTESEQSFGGAGAAGPGFCFFLCAWKME